MPTAIARVTPTDLAAWHKVHLDTIKLHGRALGIVAETIYHDHDDPRTVVLVQTISSVPQMQAFLATPTFQAIVASAPIEGPPTFWFLESPEAIDAGALWGS